MERENYLRLSPPLINLVTMIIPVRCFTCGKPISHLWEKYKERTEKGEDGKKVLDDLGVEKYCCRTAFITQADLVKEVGKFEH